MRPRCTAQFRDGKMKLFARIASLGCLMVCGCTPQADSMTAESLRLSFESSKGMSERDVALAVENAAQSRMAVVYVYVPWAPMRPQTDRFSELAVAWQSSQKQMPIGFHFIDFSDVCNDYRPLTKLPGWPTRGGRPDIGRIGGWGELVWIADGKVIHIQTALDFSDGDELAALTRELFETHESG